MIEQLFNDFGAKYLEEAKKNSVDLGLQTIYTPIDKIEKATNFRFADYITAETRSVAVLFNNEFINYFIKELPQNYINNIKFTFFYDCEFDYKQIRNYIFFAGKKLNIEMIHIENIKDLDKVMTGKKFDIVFSNPPYNDNLDLKILEKVFPIAKNIVFIHPSIFILDKRFVKDLYNRIRNTNYLSELTLFWGNKLFDIGLFTPLCISCWDISKTNNNVEVNDLAFSNATYNCKINEVSINYGSLLPLKKDFDIFFNNIKQYQRAYDKRVKPDYSDMTNFSIKLATIRGNQPVGHPVHHTGFTLDFFSYCSMDLKNNFVDSTWRAKRKNDGERLCWSFSTEKDRLNFAKYLNTKIVRFISSLIKISQNYDMTYVPWLDFTQEWNDAKLCKEFGISEELWNYIDKFIPDYYDDYKSGF